jgi:membrane protein implicated in regulation of membrane protease activity
MKRNLPPAFWVEIVLATMAALLAALTVVIPDWMERIVAVDLDGSSGSLEWQLTAAMFLAAALLSASAFRQWRKAPRTA